MKQVKNRFGSGTLYEESDLGKGIYCVCTACMSIWSDFLSFANHQLLEDDKNSKTVTPYYIEGDLFLKDTDTIVVLGCQVTDLAIHNDLQAASELHEMYPDLPIYMGGCLAQRFDINIPTYLRRLDVVRSKYEDMNCVNGLIDYRKPFWNVGLKEDDSELTTGNLFRHMYPLKIGAGCDGRCKYCTIRDTRGESYETDAYLQVNEFLRHADEDIVLISDSPTVKQIRDWCHIATRYNKPISFRNVEPQIANMCKKELVNLAKCRMLKILHCPIQSNDPKVLSAMNRDVEGTLEYIGFAQGLRDLGVIVATNIIIDYMVDGNLIHNMDEEWLNHHFDYWSWNPYFDGSWAPKKAADRFRQYII